MLIRELVTLVIFCCCSLVRVTRENRKTKVNGFYNYDIQFSLISKHVVDKEPPDLWEEKEVLFTGWYNTFEGEKERERKKETRIILFLPLFAKCQQGK